MDKAKWDSAEQIACYFSSFDNRINPNEFAVKLKIAIDEYAQQENREFFDWVIDTHIDEIIDGNLFDMHFDEWKSKQKDKPNDCDGQIFSPRI